MSATEKQSTIRALKAINAGKQILYGSTSPIPATLSDFYQFQEFPITINCVSGFYSNFKNSRILSELSEGKID